jgi:uncharacterized protein YceH (UPF0502 family)
VDVEAHAVQAQTAAAAGASERVSTAELAQRVARLEAEVADLKQRLGD